MTSATTLINATYGVKDFMEEGVKLMLEDAHDIEELVINYTRVMFVFHIILRDILYYEESE